MKSIFYDKVFTPAHRITNPSLRSWSPRWSPTHRSCLLASSSIPWIPVSCPRIIIQEPPRMLLHPNRRTRNWSNSISGKILILSSNQCLMLNNRQFKQIYWDVFIGSLANELYIYCSVMSANFLLVCGKRYSSIIVKAPIDNQQCNETGFFMIWNPQSHSF